MLSVVMLSVVMLSVVMQIVTAPVKRIKLMLQPQSSLEDDFPKGATTFSKMTFSIMTLILLTLNKTALSIMRYNVERNI